MGIPYKNLCSSLRKYVKIINAYISESVMYECDYVREWFDVHSYIHELMYPTQVCEREILHKCVQSVVCVCERVRVWVACRAKWVSGSLVFVTHWSVWRGETHYSLLDLFSFILACVPLSPPSPTSPLKSKDLEVSRLREEELGARGGGDWCPRSRGGD